MKFSALVSLVAGASAASATIQPSFILKTSSSNEEFNGLYVSTYHSGAGKNAVWLRKESEYAVPAGMNGNKQLIFSGSTIDGSETPYGLELPVIDSYAEWQPAAINAGRGNGAKYSIRQGAVAPTRESNFSSFIACKWYYGVPQLFFGTQQFRLSDLPENCDIVTVLTEGI